MSRAFVKESDGDWLGDVAPDVPALERYLTKENGGVKVYEIAKHFDEDGGREVHQMSNGNSYALDADGRWAVIFD